jgi:hypothetical protein
MKRIVFAAAVGLSALCPVAANAGPDAEKLSRCLVDNASPKDQAALVRWMFLAMSANPSLEGLAKVTPEQRDAYNKAMAATFERLVLQDCRREYVTAARTDGPAALREAFKVMGERAATQLMSDPQATKEIERFAAFLDEAKWTALAAEVGKD